MWDEGNFLVRFIKVEVICTFNEYLNNNEWHWFRIVFFCEIYNFKIFLK